MVRRPLPRARARQLLRGEATRSLRDSGPDGAPDHTLLFPAGRSSTPATQETASLVLDEEVPGSDQDVLDLVLRLRRHIAQIDAAVERPDGAVYDALRAARVLAAEEMPTGFAPSRVHLRRLGLSVETLVMKLGWASGEWLQRPGGPVVDQPEGRRPESLGSCPTRRCDLPGLESVGHGAAHGPTMHEALPSCRPQPGSADAPAEQA